jgi:hypothetical protein
VSRFGSAVFFLVCGVVGAVVSVTLLLMVPSDGAPLGYRELIADDLPVLVFATGMGFGLGILIALLWSVLQRIFAVNAPRA